MTEKPETYTQTPAPVFNPNEIPDAQKNSEVLQLYFNGFTLGITNADVVFLLKHNNIPKVVANMSLTVAKTLAKNLNALIINFEANAEREIMTTDIVDNALVKMRNGKK